MTPATEADPLFGEAGRYTASWSTHDRALGTTRLAAILRQLPVVVPCVLGWWLNALETGEVAYSKSAIGPV